MNEITIINPYWKYGTWCFTDDAIGVRDEAFVAGADEVISYLVQDIPNAEDGFQMMFSENPFPDYDLKVDHVESDGYSGNFYKMETESMSLTFWLCGCLLKYFDKAPKQIYVKIQQNGKTL